MIKSAISNKKNLFKEFPFSKKKLFLKNTLHKPLLKIDSLDEIYFENKKSFLIKKRVLSKKNNSVVILGWCADFMSLKPAKAVFVEINGKLLKAKYGFLRPDVSNYVDKNYLKSGFKAEIPVVEGSNKIKFFVISSDNKYFFESDTKTFGIKYDSEYNKKITFIPLVNNLPKISIILPVYNTNLEMLEKCILSVLNQSYSNWELCIVDDASSNKKIINYLKSLSDGRIKLTFLKKNKGIVFASNTAIKKSTGEFIGFLDHDDVLEENAIEEVSRIIRNNKNVDLIYSDELVINKFDKIVNYLFKPDFSLETLLSMNYINHFSVYRKDLVEKVGFLREGYEGSQDYDLVLRIVEKTSNIIHIPKVLYKWRTHNNSFSQKNLTKLKSNVSAKKALNAYLKRNKLNGEFVFLKNMGYWQLKNTFNNLPSVEIIIFAGPKINFLDNCLKSILKKTTYKNYKILVIDNSNSTRTNDFLEDISKKSNNIRFFVDDTKPFNFSKLANNAVKKSDAEYLIFLNDDTKLINGDWIERFLDVATKKEIGVIGSLLLYPNNTIQHAGVIVGICGCADHAFRGYPINSDGYNNFHRVIRNVSAVTFACAMVSKKNFLSVGGLDEKNFSVGFNDIDFCLKLLKKGLRNVYTPFVKLYHYESASRSIDTIENSLRFRKEVAFFNKKWKEFLEDPYYNPNLTKTGANYCVSFLNKRSFFDLIKAIFFTTIFILFALI